MKKNKFNIDLVEFPKLKQHNPETGSRYYTREGSELRYPSVTSVTGLKNAHFIRQWRERVGEEEANRVSKRAIGIGNTVHNLMENYLQGELPEGLMPIHQEPFEHLKDFADKSINNVRAIEGQMFSDHLSVAGTSDVVCEVDGVMSIVDWKTSGKKKSKSQITNYFCQAAAYAVMFEEHTKIPVSQLVIAIACGTGEFQLFQEKRDDWIQEFKNLRSQYKDIYGV